MEKFLMLLVGASLLCAGGCESADPVMTDAPDVAVESAPVSVGGTDALTVGGIAPVTPKEAVPLNEQPARKYLAFIYFDYDKSEIRPNQVPRMDMNVAFLKANPDLKVELHGFADYFSGDDYNLKLSERRVKSVYDYLIAQGVPADQLVISHHGEKDRLDEFSEGFYTDRRRRVEFEFVK